MPDTAWSAAAGCAATSTKDATRTPSAARLTARTLAAGIVGFVAERLEALLRRAFPDARELGVVDRTGTGDHFHVTVVAPRFAALSRVDQHRLVYDALAEPLADGTIHELRITTRGEG